MIEVTSFGMPVGGAANIMTYQSLCKTFYFILMTIIQNINPSMIYRIVDSQAGNECSVQDIDRFVVNGDEDINRWKLLFFWGFRSWVCGVDHLDIEHKEC